MNFSPNPFPFHFQKHQPIKGFKYIKKINQKKLFFC